jgi:hypothetical protein
LTGQESFARSYLGHAFQFSANRPGLEEALTAHLPAAADGSTGRLARSYSLEKTGRTWRWRTARGRWRAVTNPWAAAALMADDVERFLAAHAEGYLFIHAGAVAVGHRAILLPGPTLSGKSRMVEALIHRGASYLSDEFAIVDRHGFAHPWARPLALRLLDGRTVHVPVAQLGGELREHPARVRLVAFLRHRPEAGSSWRVMSPGQSTLLLLRNALSVRSKVPLAHLAVSAVMRDAVTLRGDREDAGQAADALLEQLGH